MRSDPSLPLPEFIEPMLARPASAFDSDEHLFEIKWDGTRGLAFVGDDIRIMNRRRVDISERYPELIQQLRGLPRGTILDGEIVVLKNGQPDFQALQSREQARNDFKISILSRQQPATYICFDQLYRAHKPVLSLRCDQRRELLEETLAQAARDSLLMSKGIVGLGIQYFEQVCAQNLEGIVAKRLNSPYLPGKRTDAWQKIKRQQDLVCAIIGYVAEGEADLGSIILAAEVEGTLKYVGKVGSGMTEVERVELVQKLTRFRRPKPIVACRTMEAVWVEPELFCRVRFMEWTRDRHLRAPVYGGLYEVVHG